MKDAKDMLQHCIDNRLQLTSMEMREVLARIVELEGSYKQLKITNKTGAELAVDFDGHTLTLKCKNKSDKP